MSARAGRYCRRAAPGSGRTRVSLTRLEVGHGVKLTGSSQFTVEPFENEIVHSDEILDLAQRVRDAVRHDDRAISSGLSIASLQCESIRFQYHGATPDDHEKRARYSTRRQQRTRRGPVMDGRPNAGH